MARRTPLARSLGVALAMLAVAVAALETIEKITILSWASLPASDGRAPAVEMTKVVIGGLYAAR
jgi:hypothetical protein